MNTDDFFYNCFIKMNDGTQNNNNNNNNTNTNTGTNKRKLDNISITDKKTNTDPNPNKKMKTDTELVELIINNNGNLNDILNTNTKKEIPCVNPLCDHQDYTEEELEQLKNHKIENPKPIKNIDDLIELGKLYHCKKNKVYYGLNMRLLCNLVEPLTKLKNLIGMKTVKENMVNQIIFFLQGFNKKDKCNECIDCLCGLPCTVKMNDDMLHTVITGPPGVGKTELGKILGQVYKAMGILANGEMHIATRSDLIGKFLGHTAAKTQDFINKCKGGVMFIDEAYSLGNPEGRDSYSKECLDTINQNLSEKRDFLCIIAGYADALEKCFFSYNEGLKRRFSFRYDIQPYTYNELMEIFLFKIKHDDWQTEFDIIDNDSSEIIRHKELMRLQIKDFFKENYTAFPHFGGDIESLILNCKIMHGKRVLFLDQNHKKVFTIMDIENGFTMFVSHRKLKEKEGLPENIKHMFI